MGCYVNSAIFVVILALDLFVVYTHFERRRFYKRKHMLQWYLLSLYHVHFLLSILFRIFALVFFQYSTTEPPPSSEFDWPYAGYLGLQMLPMLFFFHASFFYFQYQVSALQLIS